MGRRRSFWCPALGDDVCLTRHAIERAAARIGTHEEEDPDPTYGYTRARFLLGRLIRHGRLARGEDGKWSAPIDTAPSLVAGDLILHLVRRDGGRGFVVKTVYAHR